MAAVRLLLLQPASSNTIVQSFPGFPKPEGIKMRHPVPKKETGRAHICSTHKLSHQALPQATASTLLVPPPTRGRCCWAEPFRPSPWQQATPIVCLQLQPGAKEQGGHCSQIPASKERRIKGGQRSKAGEGRGIRGLPVVGEAEASDNRACLGKLGSAPTPTP